MTASYTSRLRLVKQGDGDNPNTWGTVLNDGMISLVDDAIAAYTTVEIGANATVTFVEYTDATTETFDFADKLEAISVYNSGIAITSINEIKMT